VAADLVAPPVQEKVRDGEEESEEDRVREVQWQRERIGGLRRGSR